MKSFSGTVVKGDGRGRLLGYPTANLIIKEEIAIPDGIYACTVAYEGKSYIGALFIGVRQMFGHTKKSVEVHILDFDQQIYGEVLTVKVGKFIRSNQVFDSIDELTEQIARDVEAIKAERCGRGIV